MHGGFAEDPDTGMIYTGIPGFGLCRISADLSKWERIGSDERLETGNVHGLCVFKHSGYSHIAVADNIGSRVLILDMEGEVEQVLASPVGGEFNSTEANAYYSTAPKQQNPWQQPFAPVFGVTDVTYLDGRLYVVTGYCDGDFVLSAEYEHTSGEWEWGPVAWGGKGDKPGQFQTAHGITAHGDCLYVANRDSHCNAANSSTGQVIQFTKEGKLVKMFREVIAL